jgi:hypothetical protein
VSILMWLAAYKFAFRGAASHRDGDMDAPEVAVMVDNGLVWRFSDCS